MNIYILIAKPCSLFGLELVAWNLWDCIQLKGCTTLSDVIWAFLEIGRRNAVGGHYLVTGNELLNWKWIIESKLPSSTGVILTWSAQRAEHGDTFLFEFGSWDHVDLRVKIWLQLISGSATSAATGRHVIYHQISVFP